MLLWRAVQIVVLLQRLGHGMPFGAASLQVPSSQVGPAILQNDLLCRCSSKGSGLSLSGKLQLVPSYQQSAESPLK